MPVLDATNIIDLKQNKQLNRGKRLSIGVILELEKMPADERRRALQFSMCTQQRRQAQDALQQHINAPITKMIKGMAPLFKQADSFAEIGKLIKAKSTVANFDMPKLTSTYYPLPLSDDEITAAEVRKLRLEVKDLKQALSHSQTPRRARRSTPVLNKQSYDNSENVLFPNTHRIKFRRARKQAAILEIIFVKYGRLHKKWDFDEFFETYRQPLYKGSIEDSLQVRSALSRINDKVAIQSKGAILDLFVIDNGFRINPIYLRS